MDIKLPTSAGSLKKKSEVKSLSRVPLFLTPMDCSAPGSCIHGIFQARVLEWVAISYSRISSWPRYQIRVSHIAGRCFTIWATKRKTSTSALLTTPKPLTVWITTNCENSSRDGNTRPRDLPPEKSFSGQEATVRTGHGTIDWFQIGKGICQGCILSPCLFNLYAEYIMRNAGLEEAQAGVKIAGRNINDLRYADDTPPLRQKVKKN